MATRFYLVATTAASISPSLDASWTSTTGAVRRMMATTQDVATEQVTSDIGATGPAYTLAGQFVSPPLAAQTITGTVTITSRGRETNINANVNKRARSVRVYSGDGATLRGTVNAWTATASTTELSATTLQGQIHATNGTLTSVTCLDGDVLVVELGYGVGTSGTIPQAIMAWGGAGTDHANTNSDTTGSVPWVEFSQDLVFQSGPATVLGTATADFGFTTTATGVREVPGTAAVSPAFAATAAGVVTGGSTAVVGVATAALTFTSTAAGTRAVTGPASAPLAFTSAASGLAASPGAGTAQAGLAFTATASAVRAVAASAVSALAFTSAAAGVRSVAGLASTSLTFLASAAGSTAEGLTMARLIGPDESCRLVYQADGRANAQTLTGTLYADEAGTVLADVLTFAGGPVTGSVVTVDAYSKLPLIQFPDGVDTIYVSVAGGPVVPLYARTDDRIDTLAARVTATEAVANAAVAVPPLASGEWRANPGPATANLSLVVGTEHATQVFLPAGTVLQSIAVWVAITAASTNVRLGIRADSGHQASTLLLDAGVVPATVGVQSIPISYTVPAGAATGVPIWLTATAQGTNPVTVVGCTATAEYRDGTTAAMAMGFRAAQRQTGVSGALPTTFVSSSNISTAVAMAVQAA